MRKKITLALQGIVDPKYKAYSKRIHHACKTYQDLVDGFDIGLFTYQSESIEKLFGDDLIREKLDHFEHNSVHVANSTDYPLKMEDITRIVGFCNSLFFDRLINSVSFHLDISPFFDHIRSLSSPGLTLLWENLGKDAGCANSYKEIVEASERFSDWGIVFDIAHALETESEGQPSIEKHIEFLNDKIKQMHFSWPANLYTEKQMGLNFITGHSLVHMNSDSERRIKPILKHSKAEVITIEGVVPPGDLGKQLIANEVDMIQKIIF